MSDAREHVDGHQIDYSTLLQYRFPPPPENRIYRYWDNVKKFSHAAVLHIAVFCFAVYCAFPYFDYLKMRAKGRLSRWFYVPEWEVFREDKDGHELGSIEQMYEPVEEHRRAAFNALMERKYGAGAQIGSQPPTLFGTPRESFTEQMDSTQEGAAGVLTLPPDTDQETLVLLQKVAELMHKAKATKNVEVPNEPCALSSTQTQQADPSRIDVSSFSQYSIHPDSPEHSDHNSVLDTTPSKTKELPSPSLQPSRKTRPFRTSAHSHGETIWMTTTSYEDLPNPPEPVPEDEPGVLYIHRNLTDNMLQVWLLRDEKQWAAIQLGVKTQHPTFKDRYLAVRLDGTPSWITLASWYTAKKRVNS
ncbi:hypothetical protein BDM02DRAFT_2194320 [Thelephora ganbajun]|uniref:Uncharacterized protein n=1 Tax=Thelephora ganbajun TaxID=370292 RepID=A0ACB6ZHL0_THEGA|nr:hypothetical protein BDM02DRAFT_2194320 [Thelephora ganbajun]